MSFVPQRDIEDAALVTPYFGGWPCFHDAEILHLTLQREKSAAYLQGVFHVFNPSHDSADQSQQRHMLVVLRFEAVKQLKLEGFNHQNVIDDLKIETVSEGQSRFEVDLPANNGSDASFSCDSIRVLSVEPYRHENRIQDGSVYAEMTASENILARESKASYIWAALIAVAIAADMLLYGVTSSNALPALLSIVFASFMFGGRRLEARVIARYQELGPPVGRMTLATRLEILRLITKGLWAGWFALLGSSFVLRLGGNLNLSQELVEGMIAYIFFTILLRVCVAGALFWPRRQTEESRSR